MASIESERRVIDAMIHDHQRLYPAWALLLQLLAQKTALTPNVCRFARETLSAMRAHASSMLWRPPRVVEQRVRRLCAKR